MACVSGLHEKDRLVLDLRRSRKFLRVFAACCGAGVETGSGFGVGAPQRWRESLRSREGEASQPDAVDRRIWDPADSRSAREDRQRDELQVFEDC